MPTIKDVAKLAGVSTSTVSRALSGNVNVNDTTKERIFSAIAELKYVPDHIARSLKNGRTRTISLLVPTMLNPFFPKLVDRFNAEINSYGYATFLNINNYSKEEEIRSLISAKRFSVDGVLYVPGTDDTRHIGDMISSGIPMVIVNRAPELKAPCVTNDDMLGGYSALEYLIKKGHRKICCFVGNTDLQNMRERYKGCMKALADYDVDLNNVLFVREDATREVYQRVNEIIEQDRTISAFFASSDWMTKEIYSAVLSSGLSIPNDISVVGFDDISDSQYMFPPLTTWRHPIDSIAHEAVSMLVAIIENNADYENRRVVLPGKMIERDSVKTLVQIEQ